MADGEVETGAIPASAAIIRLGMARSRAGLRASLGLLTTANRGASDAAGERERCAMRAPQNRTTGTPWARSMKARVPPSPDF